MEDEIGVQRAPINLTKRTFSGLRWSYLEAGAVGVMQVVYTATMSRLLDPAAFGLMAIAAITVHFGQQFARMGVSQAIIQKPTLSEDNIRAGYTSGMLLGITCFAGLWFLAPWLSEFFGKQDAVWLLRATAAQLLVVGLSMTSLGLLRRDLRFRELGLIQMVTFLLAYLVIALGLALAGAGAWALAAGVVGSSVIQGVLLYARARHSLRPTLRPEAYRSLFSFGVRFSGLSFMEFLGKNVDTATVGRYASAALVGQYSRAFTLVNLPLNFNLSSALTKVLFPSFTKIQTDRERLKRAYVGVLALGATAFFPLCAGIAVAAPEVVEVVLGDQWDLAATVVPFFAVAVGCNIMTKFAELVVEARAELNKALALQGGYLALLVAALVAVGGTETIWPFAAVLCAGELLRQVAFLMLMRRVIGLEAREVVGAYGPGLISAAVVSLLILAGRQALLAQAVPVFFVLLGEVLLGAIGLALSLRFNPMPAVRIELHNRLRSAGLISGGWTGRLVRCVLG